MSTNVAPAANVKPPMAAADAAHFPVSTADLERIARSMIDTARDVGATAAETEVSQAVGQSITVRKGDVETIAYHRDKSVSITVYVVRSGSLPSVVAFR